MKKAIVIIIVIAALAVGTLLYAPGIISAQSVPTAQPTLGAIKSSGAIIAEGSVIPVQDTSLSFATSGVISAVLVSEGQAVPAGQVLARLTGAEALQATLSGTAPEILTASARIWRESARPPLTQPRPT